MVRTYQEWDWEGGEAAFRKAIEINPNYADARAFYAGLLYVLERAEEGRAQMERALELDPFNPLFRAMNGYRLLLERRYAESIEELQAAQRIEPNHPVAFNLANVYHLTGSHDEALAQLRIWFPGDQELDEALDQGYAEGGYRAALLRFADTLAARPEAAEQLSPLVTFPYAWAEDKERTLEWLDLAYRAHDSNLPAMLSHACEELELVHDDPRYRDLRLRVGLPE
jgi:tetratricopeptide (TPR) repeat protein